MTTVFAGHMYNEQNSETLKDCMQLLIKDVKMEITQTGTPLEKGLDDNIPTGLNLANCPADAYAVSMGDHCSAFIVPEQVPKDKIPYIGVPLAGKDDIISFPLQKPPRGGKKLAPLLTLHAYSFKNTSPGEYDSLSHASSLPILLSIPLSFALGHSVADHDGYVRMEAETVHNGTNTGQKHLYSLKIKAENFNAVTFSEDLNALTKPISGIITKHKLGTGDKCLNLTSDILDQNFTADERYLRVNNPLQKECASFRTIVRGYILKAQEDNFENKWKSPEVNQDFDNLPYNSKTAYMCISFAMLTGSEHPVASIAGIESDEECLDSTLPPAFSAAFLQPREERANYPAMRAAVTGFFGENISREALSKVCNALHPTSPYASITGDRCPENCRCDHSHSRCICTSEDKKSCQSFAISPSQKTLCITAMRTFLQYLRASSTALNLSITGGHYSFDMVCLGKDKNTGKRVLVNTENTQQPWSAVNSYLWSLGQKDEFLGVRTVARSDDCESLGSFQNQLSDSLAVLGDPACSVPAAYFENAEALPEYKVILEKMGIHNMSKVDQRALLHFANTLYELTRSQNNNKPDLLIESGFLVTQGAKAQSDPPKQGDPREKDSKASVTSSMSKHTAALKCKRLYRGDMASRLKMLGPSLGKEKDNKTTKDTRMPGGHSTTIYMHTNGKFMRVFFAESTAYLIPVADNNPVEIVSRFALGQDLSPRSASELGELGQPLHSSEIAEMHMKTLIGSAANAVVQNLIISNFEMRPSIVMNTDTSINHTIETFYNTLVSAGEYSFFTMHKDEDGRSTHWKAGVSLKDVINEPAINVLTTEQMKRPISELTRKKVTSMVAVKSCTVDERTKSALSSYQGAISTPKVPAEYQAQILNNSLPTFSGLPTASEKGFFFPITYRMPDYWPKCDALGLLKARNDVFNKRMGNVRIHDIHPVGKNEFYMKVEIEKGTYMPEETPKPCLPKSVKCSKPVAKKVSRFNTSWGHW
jgi:hypothetical protein